MKRLFLALIGVSLVFAPVMAQARLGDFTMRGAASQEMRADGFVAAHPSFPLNSKVKVTNPINGREIEAIIIDRIDPSLNRVIDLSPSAMQALGMRAGDQVILTVGAPPRPLTRSQKNDEPIIELIEPVAPSLVVEDIEKLPESPVSPQKTAEKPADTENKNDRPYNVTVNAYLDEKNAANQNSAPSPNNNTEFLAWLMTMSSLDAREARDAREVREGREIREAREAVKTPPPAPRQREVYQPPAPPTPQYIPQYAPQYTPAPQTFFDSAPVFQSAPAPQYTPPVQHTPAPHQYTQPEPHKPVYHSVPSVPETQYTPTQPPVAPAAPNYKHIPPPAPDQSPAALAPTAHEPAVPPPSAPTAPAATAPAEQPSSKAAAAAPEPPLKEQEPIPVRHVPPAATYPLPVKAEDVQIIGLPDRSSGKTYRLQVGAYSAQDAATRAAEHIRASGFDVELESSGSIFRVLAVGIASADVHPASVRLGSLGFRQIWVRE